MSVFENFSKPIKAAINRKANRMAQELVPRLRMALADKLVEQGLITTSGNAEWRAEEMLVAVSPDMALEGVRDLQVRALLDELQRARSEVRELKGRLGEVA